MGAIFSVNKKSLVKAQCWFDDMYFNDYYGQSFPKQKFCHNHVSSLILFCGRDERDMETVTVCVCVCVCERERERERKRERDELRL